MPQTLYCWRCKCDVPMLTDEEWDRIYQKMSGQRSRFSPSRLADRYLGRNSRFGSNAAARREYERITGYRETNINAIWHHRLALHGPPCKHCGKPLRTARASFCAACGTAA